MSNKTKAEEIRKRIYDYTITNSESSRRHDYFGYLILHHFDEVEKTSKLRKEWESNTANLTYQWYHAKRTKDIKKTEEIEKKKGNDPRFRIIVEAVKFIDKWK